MTPQPVGVVGLGVMRSAMSTHLLAAGRLLVTPACRHRQVEVVPMIPREGGN